MKNKTFGNKMITSLLATILIAPTVLGAIPITESLGTLNVSAEEVAVDAEVPVPTNVEISRNGKIVNATIEKGTKLIILDRLANELGTSDTGKDVELNRKLEPKEDIFLVTESVETGKESKRVWATYNETRPSITWENEISIETDGKSINYNVNEYSEEEELVALDSEEKELGTGKEGKIELSRPLVPNESIWIYIENVKTEIRSESYQFTYPDPDEVKEISDIEISRNGREVLATIPEDAKLFVVGDNGDELGSSILGKVKLNRKLEPQEEIYLYVEYLLTGEIGERITSKYDEVEPEGPDYAEISPKGNIVIAEIPENTKLIVLDGKGDEVGSSETGEVTLSRNLVHGEEIQLVTEDLVTEIRSSSSTYITFYAEGPEAPTDIQIAKDGKYVTFVRPDNTEVFAIDERNEVLGSTKDSGKIEFSRQLKHGDFIYLKAVDLTTKDENISDSVQYFEERKIEKPKNVEINELGTTIYADMAADNTMATVVDSKGNVLGYAQGYKDYTSVIRLSRKLTTGETVDVYSNDTYSPQKSEPTKITYKEDEKPKVPQGPYISYGKYVTVVSSNYNTYSNFSWKVKLNAKDVTNKTYYAKGKYNHENGNTYLSLYDEKNVWQGYINEKATKLGDGKQGAYIADGRYVTVLSSGYNTWSNFSWKVRLSGAQVEGKTFLSRGKYKHINGSTYLSLFNEKGEWQGYINEKAAKAGVGKQGAYIADGRQVIVTKKGYNTWANFNWKKKQSTNNLVGKEFTARGRYNHINGSTYCSLFDSKGEWQGYLNVAATKFK